MRLSTDTPRSPRRAFTLIELLVMVALLAILATVIFPAIQASRQRETLVKADQRIKQISSATLAYYEEHGVWPDSFARLQLEPDFKAKLVGGEPVEGSTFRLRTVQRAVEVSSAPANPMRITQRLAVVLDGKAVVNFRKDGSVPDTVYTKDEVATRENALRTQRVLGEFIETVMNVCDCDEAETSSAIDESQQDVSTRDAAWALIDPNEDGYVTQDEIFERPWEGIPLYGDQVRSFIDYSEAELEIEDDESPVVTVADGGRWRHMLLGTIGNQLDLVTTTRRTGNELNNLYQVLGHVSDSLLRADLSGAIGNVARFQQKLETLVTSNVVSQEQADLTLNTAGLLRASLTQTLEKVPPSLWTPPGSAPLHVDWTAPGDEGATGGEEDPFPDVVAALAYAERRAFPAVEIIVHPGIYGGDLEITRDTRITGVEGAGLPPLHQGKLINDGPFTVELANLLLTSDKENSGVIQVDHPTASTYLRSVRIDGSVGFAIHQSGGEFRCHELRVDGTVAYSVDVGVAMQFDRGVKAELSRVEMRGNRVAALLVSDPTTEVRATHLDIRGTRANSFAIQALQEEIRGNRDYEFDTVQPGTCAVDVRNGAYFQGAFVNVIDNEYVGLIVHSDGHAELSDSEISHTAQVTQLGKFHLGFNVAVLDTGHLNMTVVTLSHAYLGLYITGDPQVDLRGTTCCPSVVSHCDLAVAISTYEPYDAYRVQYEVWYVNNGQDLVSERLPIPNVTPPLPP